MTMGKKHVAEGAEKSASDNNKKYTLRLYVTGATPNSLRAISNIKNICERYIAGKYSLNIIDVYKHKEVALHEQLLALPMLIKIHPGPERKLIGDLSNVNKVMDALGLKTNE